MHGKALKIILIILALLIVTVLTIFPVSLGNLPAASSPEGLSEKIKIKPLIFAAAILPFPIAQIVFSGNTSLGLYCLFWVLLIIEILLLVFLISMFVLRAVAKRASKKIHSTVDAVNDFGFAYPVTIAFKNPPLRVIGQTCQHFDFSPLRLQSFSQVGDTRGCGTKFRSVIKRDN